MGNTTTRSLGPTGLDEACARIGVALEAQRVELYEAHDVHDEAGGTAVLRRRWSAPGATACDTPDRLPLLWFPWSLGNVRPEEYLFVRNAGSLPAGPDSRVTLAEVGMRSVLHLPVVNTARLLVGGVCAYWSVERSGWASDRRVDVCSLASDALDNMR